MPSSTSTFTRARDADADALVRLFDDGVRHAGNGVAGVGTPDDIGLALAGRHPDRFILFGGGGVIRGFIQDEGEGAWNLESAALLRYLHQLEVGLQEGRFQGIGELHVNATTPRLTVRYPADSPLMQRLWALSATYDVPLSVHMNADAVPEMERLLPSDRRGTWIWAHAGATGRGVSAEAPLVRRLLEEHANLYCDLSGRRGFLQEDGRFREDRQDWRELLEDLSDRFTIGTDTSERTLSGYAEDIRYWRRVLDQLSPEAAANVAHRTAERLLRLPPSTPTITAALPAPGR